MIESRRGLVRLSSWAGVTEHEVEILGEAARGRFRVRWLVDAF